MSEKIYVCVLRLLAPRFYRVYGEEATCLVRDRCRDEQGVIGKIRLWLDLLSDLLVAAIRDDRFAPNLLSWRLAAAHAVKPAPSFAVVRGGLPPTAALLLGGALSLGFFATISSLIDGGRREAASPPLGGVLRYSPTRATFEASRINEHNRLLRLSHVD